MSDSAANPPRSSSTSSSLSSSVASSAPSKSPASSAPELAAGAAAQAPADHPSPAAVPFVLYALRSRVYASNVKNKLVDLGHLSKDGACGTYTYLLDGDKSTGSGFADAQEALAHIAQTTSFLFLDGQFTALEDLAGPDGAGLPDLSDAPQLEIALAPPRRSE